MLNACKKEFDLQVAVLRRRPPEEFREQIRGLCRHYGRQYYLTLFMQEAMADEVSTHCERAAWTDMTLPELHNRLSANVAEAGGPRATWYA